MRTAVRAGAGLLAAIVASVLVAPPASHAAPRAAAPRAETPSAAGPLADSSGGVQCQPVEVAGDTAGFTSPASVGSGVRTFNVTTTNPTGIVLGLFRLDAGVDVNEFVALLKVAFAGVGQERVDAGNAVAAQSTLLGGVAALPGRPATFSQTLVPGTYHLINYRDILSGTGGTVAVRPLTATSQWQPCLPPQPRATVEMVNTAEGPRFRAPSTIRQGSPLLVVNLSGRIQEAVIRPVTPTTTAADVKRFFDEVDTGQPPTSNPFLGLIPQGMPVIHPSLAEIIQPNLAPGRYAMLSFLLDDAGIRYARHGMVVVFDVI